MEELNLKEDNELTPVMKDVYRRLRTNIEFTGLENRVLCITSCGENAGKSTVSFHLAQMFAEDDKNVLLIDADMRNSVLYYKRKFNKNTIGLSNVLSGQEKLSDAIYQTNYPKLFLMPTGVFPANPTELLNKPRFKKVIESVKNSFDYVIIDTPPLGSVVDAAVVARESDGSVLVISQNHVSRRAAVAIKNQLVQANPNLLGVVLNRVGGSGKGYGYGYGKKYGYGYGYGYGGEAYGTGKKSGKKEK